MTQAHTHTHTEVGRHKSTSSPTWINYVNINHKSDKDINCKDAAIELSCQSPIDLTKDTRTHTHAHTTRTHELFLMGYAIFSGLCKTETKCKFLVWSFHLYSLAEDTKLNSSGLISEFVNVIRAEVSGGKWFFWQGTETRKASTFVWHKKEQSRKQKRKR